MRSLLRFGRFDPALPKPAMSCVHNTDTIRLPVVSRMHYTDYAPQSCSTALTVSIQSRLGLCEFETNCDSSGGRSMHRIREMSTPVDVTCLSLSSGWLSRPFGGSLPWSQLLRSQFQAWPRVTGCPPTASEIRVEARRATSGAAAGEGPRTRAAAHPTQQHNNTQTNTTQYTHTHLHTGTCGPAVALARRSQASAGRG